MNFKLIMVLILIAFVILFVIQNVAVVEIQFLFWSIEMSRSLMIFALLITGVIVGWLLHSYSGYRKRKTAASLERARESEEE